MSTRTDDDQRPLVEKLIISFVPKSVDLCPDSEDVFLYKVIDPVLCLCIVHRWVYKVTNSFKVRNPFK